MKKQTTAPATLSANLTFLCAQREMADATFRNSIAKVFANFGVSNWTRTMQQDLAAEWKAAGVKAGAIRMRLTRIRGALKAAKIAYFVDARGGAKNAKGKKAADSAKQKVTKKIEHVLPDWAKDLPQLVAAWAEQHAISAVQALTQAYERDIKTTMKKAA